MSLLSQFIMSGGGKLRYQEFNSSGTFVPSAKLLANGGQCFVTLIGGGGAGGGATSGNYGCGGDGGQHIEAVVTVSGNISVIIGAGGAGVTDEKGMQGGDSQFGALLTAKGGEGGEGNLNTSSGSAGGLCGGAGASSLGGRVSIGGSSIRENLQGGCGINGRAGGGGASSILTQIQFRQGRDGGGDGGTSDTATEGSPNTGGGGGGLRGTGAGKAGGSGWCRVVWFE